MAGTEENPIVYPPLEMPDSVERTKVTVWVQGLAIDADIYRPKSLTEDQKVPAIAMSHGVGGDKFTCERYAAKFAENNMVAISFSQIGWGDSQGRINLVDQDQKPDENGVLNTSVSMALEVIDPLDWVDCYLAAIDYLAGEPGVDTGRIGAWGTSFGGGTALYATAMDSRIKALSVQVPAVFNPPAEMVGLGMMRAQQIARGDIPSFPVGVDTLPGLRGTPHFARMARYLVGDQAEKVNVPTQILDAQNEEMFDITVSGGLVHQRLKERGVETYYEVLPDIDHYGIYFDGYERGSKLALEWFLKHL